MPLCNGIRPSIEYYPDKEQEAHNVQAFTSRTTSDVVSMVNSSKNYPVEPVTRALLEKTDPISVGQTKQTRKALLDALFGKEMDPTDRHNIAIGLTGNDLDKAKFLRHSLGSKVVKVWTKGKFVKVGAGLFYDNIHDKSAYMFPDQDNADEISTDFLSATLKKVGGVDPRAPDKRGEYRMPTTGLNLSRPSSARPSSARRAATSSPHRSPASARASRPAASSQLASEHQSLGALLRAAKPSAFVQILQARHMRPSQVLGTLLEVFRECFETPRVHVDKFHLSIAEVVGVAEDSETLHIPHHTERERTFLMTFRALCRIKLRALVHSDTADDFEGFGAVPDFSRDMLELAEAVLESSPPWQTKALQTFFSLNKRMISLRLQEQNRRSSIMNNAFTPKVLSEGRSPPTVRSGPSGVFSPTPEACLGAGISFLGDRDSHMDLEGYITLHPLEPEWYERLHILRRRDRRFVKEQLEQLFQSILAPKKAVKPIDDDEAGSFTSRIAASRADLIGSMRSFKPPPALPRRRTSIQMNVNTLALGVLGSKDVVEVKPGSLRSQSLLNRSFAMSRKSKEELQIFAMLDAPHYWLDTRGGGAIDTEEACLSARGERILRDIERDDDVVLKRGRVGVSAKEIARKAIERVEKRRSLAVSRSSQDLEYSKYVRCLTGVQPGRPASDPSEVSGASRGACVFRLVPSYPTHDGVRTRHPIMRPPSARLRDKEQFDMVQRLLETPHVDGKGEFDGDGPIISRPPTATPRSHRISLQQQTSSDRIFSQPERASSRMSLTSPRPPDSSKLRPQSARPLMGRRSTHTTVGRPESIMKRPTSASSVVTSSTARNMRSPAGSILADIRSGDSKSRTASMENSSELVSWAVEI